MGFKVAAANIAHIVYGILAGFVAQTMPAATISMTIVFISYQIFDMKNENGRWPTLEMIEYGGGLFIGVLSRITAALFGIHPP